MLGDLLVTSLENKSDEVVMQEYLLGSVMRSGLFSLRNDPRVVAK